LQKETAGKDITGQRFGRLVVLHRMEEKRNGNVMWRLRCDCGIEIEHTVSGLGTRTNSCGCLRREKTAQRAIARNHRLGYPTRNREKTLASRVAKT
jgi:hypothetical protein